MHAHGLEVGLNNLMILHIHKKQIHRQELERVANKFVSGREGRLRMFVAFL